MICPHCRQTLADNPSLAGQMVKCPLCGGEFVLAGGASRPPPVFAPSGLASRSVRRPSSARSNIKPLMLAATGVYVVLVVGILAYFSIIMAAADAKTVADATNDYAKEMRHYKKLPRGGYMDNRSGDLYSESGMENIRQIYAPRPNPTVGLWVGAIYCIFPTAIYFVVIGVLLVLNFASKPG